MIDTELIDSQYIYRESAELYLRRQQTIEGINLTQVKELINKSYDDSEGELWLPCKQRTSEFELLNLIQDRGLWLACHQDQVVGSISLNRLDKNRFEFGLLSVAAPYRRQGLGQSLVATVEKEARLEGGHRLEFEIVLPATYTLGKREVLKTWYQKLGFKFERLETSSALDPIIAEKAAICLKVERWSKGLRAKGN